MKVPTEGQIEVVISEITSDLCEELGGRKCQLCMFREAMAERTHPDEQMRQEDFSQLDQFIMQGFKTDSPVVAASIMMAGPAIVKMVQSIGMACFLLGYKVHENQQVAAELEKAFGE